MKQRPKPIDGTLRKSFLRVPEVIRECSGINIFGKRIKSLVFSTDLAIIKNVNADALDRALTTPFDVGALTTTPIAPCNSALVPNKTERIPFVRPPPTPAKTGMSEAIMIDCVIIGWGVNGYTAITASAFTFFIIAKSVEKTRDLIRFPKIVIPLHSLITSGTRKNDFLSVPSIGFGFGFGFIYINLLEKFIIIAKLFQIFYY